MKKALSQYCESELLEKKLVNSCQPPSSPVCVWDSDCETGGMSCISGACVCNSPVITDVQVVDGQLAKCPDPETYEKVKVGGDANGDFNQGANGDFIWLCV